MKQLFGYVPRYSADQELEVACLYCTISRASSEKIQLLKMTLPSVGSLHSHVWRLEMAFSWDFRRTRGQTTNNTWPFLYWLSRGLSWTSSQQGGWGPRTANNKVQALGVSGNTTSAMVYQSWELQRSSRVRKEKSPISPSWWRERQGRTVRRACGVGSCCDHLW